MEEDQGLPAAANALFVRRIDDPVHGGNPLIVSPLCHEVAQIDDEGSRHDGHGHPATISGLHFKTAWLVLGLEDCQPAVIGVRACPQLAVL